MAFPQWHDFHMSADKVDSPHSVSANSREEWYANLPAALREAGKRYRLQDKAQDWSKLAELSDHTVFRGIDIFGANSVYDAGAFVAPANVYVTLIFDPDSSKKVTLEEAFPARVFFKIVGEDGSSEKRSVEIEHVEADTSSFLE